MACLMLIGQAGMVRQAGGANLDIFPAGLACIVLVFLSALLPLLGKSVWMVFGFQSGIDFAGAAVGILFAAYGVLEHFFLVRSLAPAEEAAR
jgi:hypothetical protein